MLYSEYMDQVKELALYESEDTGVTYIVPEYEYILAHQNFSLADVTDFPAADLQTVRRQLELERDMRNAQKNYSVAVAAWMHQFVDQAMNPAMTEAENQLMAEVIAYRNQKANGEKEQKTAPVFGNGFVMQKKKPKE